LVAKKRRLRVSAIWAFETVGTVDSIEEPQTDSLVERFALQWVQKYISSFGGDPYKVIM